MGVKLRPGQPIRRFVGIDVTDSLDTVVFGDMWNAIFGWRNLLWDLNRDPADSQRRVDNGHPKLPLRRLHRRHRGVDHADTVVLPLGVDASETDGLWAAPGDSKDGVDFMQTFILNPRADAATSTLSDAGDGAVADVVYVSSHGLFTGDMFGGFISSIFELTRAAQSGAQFAGPGWILLSNCSTLGTSTHGDWLKLLAGPEPARGLLGFEHACPLAAGSADIFATFIRRLAAGKTFIQAWSGALAAHGLASNWAALCAEQATGDTISRWNDDRLTPMPAGRRMLAFNDANPAGVAMAPVSDPFEVFWTKGATRITPLNRRDPANVLDDGDAVSITVKPPTGSATFAPGTRIAVTLVAVRTDFPLFLVDVTTEFTVVGQTGAAAPSFAHLKTASDHEAAAGRAMPDSWVLIASHGGAGPPEVRLDLTCVRVRMPEPGLIFWLRVDIGAGPFDFITNASIRVKP